MHPNPIYRQADNAANLDFAREQGFGMLAVNGPDAPLLSHIPFLLDAGADRGADAGGAQGDIHAEFHLVRSNPIARALRGGPLPAKIAVQGPHAYVSPDWYDMDDQVPTWNYVAVHLTGTIETLPDTDMRPLLDRISAFHEQRYAPKPEWLTSKMPDDLMDKMMRQIVPCRMRVTAIDGTWKLAQNKPESARLGAARAMDAANIGQEARQLAALMHRPPQPDT